MLGFKGGILVGSFCAQVATLQIYTGRAGATLTLLGDAAYEEELVAAWWSVIGCKPTQCDVLRGGVILCNG